MKDLEIKRFEITAARVDPDRVSKIDSLSSARNIISKEKILEEVASFLGFRRIKLYDGPIRVYGYTDEELFLELSTLYGLNVSPNGLALTYIYPPIGTLVFSRTSGDVEKPVETIPLVVGISEPLKPDIIAIAYSVTYALDLLYEGFSNYYEFMDYLVRLINRIHPEVREIDATQRLRYFEGFPKDENVVYITRLPLLEYIKNESLVRSVGDMYELVGYFRDKSLLRAAKAGTKDLKVYEKIDYLGDYELLQMPYRYSANLNVKDGLVDIFKMIFGKFVE